MVAYLFNNKLSNRLPSHRISVTHSANRKWHGWQGSPRGRAEEGETSRRRLSEAFSLTFNEIPRFQMSRSAADLPRLSLFVAASATLTYVCLGARTPLRVCVREHTSIVCIYAAQVWASTFLQRHMLGLPIAKITLYNTAVISCHLN